MDSTANDTDGVRQELTLEEKREVLYSTFSGKSLEPWLPGGEWRKAKPMTRGEGGSHSRGAWMIVSGGIGVANTFTEIETESGWIITWKEVQAIISAGATPELMADYRRANEAWAKHHAKWERFERYWDKDRPRCTEEQQEQRNAEYSAASKALRSTRLAIIEEGLGLRPSQASLFG